MPTLLVPIIQQICLLGEGERFRDGDYRQLSYFLSAGRHKDGMQIGTISTVIPFVKPAKDAAFEQNQSIIEQVSKCLFSKVQ